MDSKLQELRSRLAQIDKQLDKIKAPALVATIEDARAEREAAQDKADLHRIKSTLLTQIRQREEELEKAAAKRAIDGAEQRVKLAEKELQKLVNEFNELSQRQKEIIAQAIQISQKIESSVHLAYQPRKQNLSNSTFTRLQSYVVNVPRIAKSQSPAGDYHIFEISAELV
jgi:DNA-directed RNA polymerase subunit F